MRDCEIHGAVCGTETFSESELRAAAAEISPELNGKILMHAIEIVRHRRRLRSLSGLARRLGLPRNTFLRYARGGRCSRSMSFQTVMQRLATFDAEGERL